MILNWKAVAATAIAAPLIIAGGAVQVAFVQGFLKSGTAESSPAPVAESRPTQVADFFVQDQQVVCQLLDESPTVHTLVDIIEEDLVPQRYTPPGHYVLEVMMSAATDICPQHYNLVYSVVQELQSPLPEPGSGWAGPGT